MMEEFFAREVVEQDEATDNLVKGSPKISEETWLVLGLATSWLLLSCHRLLSINSKWAAAV